MSYAVRGHGRPRAAQPAAHAQTTPHMPRLHATCCGRPGSEWSNGMKCPLGTGASATFQALVVAAAVPGRSSCPRPTHTHACLTRGMSCVCPTDSAPADTQMRQPHLAGEWGSCSAGGGALLPSVAGVAVLEVWERSWRCGKRSRLSLALRVQAVRRVVPEELGAPVAAKVAVGFRRPRCSGMGQSRRGRAQVGRAGTSWSACRQPSSMRCFSDVGGRFL